MLNKITDIKHHLKVKFMEREEVIDSLFVSIVARQHTLLIGPPGTAKSALVMEFSKQFAGLSYFQWLLTRFSTPEELFGPVSLQELEKGVYKRNTAHKLPETQLTFLDEIFKANSAILNALLTAINERLFYNNGTPVKMRLISVIGGSNEYPEEGEGLEALFDRFLLRFELDYIGEEVNFMSMLKNDSAFIQPPSQLTIDEILQLQDLADMVTIPDDVLKTLLRIRNELKDEGIRPSDRRFRQSLSLIKAQAALEGRNSAKVTDILILKNGLWETVDQKAKTIEIVENHAADQFKMELDRITQISKEVYAAVQQDSSTEVGMEATTKLKASLSDLVQLEQKYPERSAEVEVIKKKVIKAQEKIGSILLGI
ncbi:AAA family ATPase [Cytobacillus pseudoceanisediminis]|uniref:AAA family ATPase n=1 Tax=Cytobacillus pseudoceanisediminis TaxID=3051614 RepID=UPI003C2B3B4C